MGIFSSFKKPIHGIQEAGIGLVSRGSIVSESGVDEEPQEVSLQQQFVNAYHNFPIVAAAVDTTAEQAVQDFYFEGDNSDSLTKWAEKVNLPQKFLMIAKHLLINGNCWVEIPNSTEMKIVDPTTMTTWRKKTGEVIGHSQEIEFQNKVLWGTTGDPDKDAEFKKHSRMLKNIVHFKFNALAGRKYGKSIIHSCLNLLATKDQIEMDLRVMVRRYASPIIHAKLGDAMHLPKDSDITATQSKLKDIYSDTEYVTNFLTDLKVLGFEGKALNVEYILKHIDNNIIAGLQTPGELIGIGESGKDAEVKLRSFGRHVKSLQRTIKTDFEDIIVVQRGLGNKEDHIVWGDAEEREHEIEIDILRGLVTDGIITPQKANTLLPPEFHEVLPDPLDMQQQMQNQSSQDQDQKPFQKGADKIKDNPTNPTLNQKEPNQRRVKTDRKIPILTNGKSKVQK